MGRRIGPRGRIGGSVLCRYNCEWRSAWNTSFVLMRYVEHSVFWNMTFHICMQQRTAAGISIKGVHFCEIIWSFTGSVWCRFTFFFALFIYLSTSSNGGSSIRNPFAFQCTWHCQCNAIAKHRGTWWGKIFNKIKSFTLPRTLVELDFHVCWRMNLILE